MPSRYRGRDVPRLQPPLVQGSGLRRGEHRAARLDPWRGCRM